MKDAISMIGQAFPKPRRHTSADATEWPSPRTRIAGDPASRIFTLRRIEELGGSLRLASD